MSHSAWNKHKCKVLMHFRRKQIEIYQEETPYVIVCCSDRRACQVYELLMDIGLDESTTIKYESKKYKQSIKLLQSQRACIIIMSYRHAKRLEKSKSQFNIIVCWDDIDEMIADGIKKIMNPIELFLVMSPFFTVTQLRKDLIYNNGSIELTLK